jgi:choline dehydrogenase-like flavoprotein
MSATAVQHREHHEGAGHIMGTLRMGADAKTSVVDAELRSHDHANLFVVGGAVFPSAGTANPTLTIAGLSLRCAETIHRTGRQL